MTPNHKHFVEPFFAFVYLHIKVGVNQAEERDLAATVNKLHLSVRSCLKDKPGQYLSDYKLQV